MNANSLAGTELPKFGSSAAGLIFLSVLIGYFFVNALTASFLDFAWVESALSIKDRSENELAALKRAYSGVLGPCLAFLITIGLLKVAIPRQSVRELLSAFGLGDFPRTKILLVSFLAGVALVVVFTKLLAVVFPPPVSAVPHPANIINYGSTFEKLLFVLSVVVLAPLAEEFLFRGVLYSGFSQSWNKPVAAFVVSASFILIHPETISSGYWLTHVLLVVISIVLVLVREVTQTIFTCIMIHSGFNFAVLFF